MKTNDDFERLINVYQDYYRDSSWGGMKRARFVFGDYQISVVPEQFAEGDHTLGYAILYEDTLIFLYEEDDTVGRYRTYEQMVAIIESVKAEWLRSERLMELMT